MNPLARTVPMSVKTLENKEVVNAPTREGLTVGAVEMLNRRLTGNRFHQYLNPEREIDAGAIEVHGITNAMLADKPKFADIAADFLAFVQGAELVIHNAPFDTGFINSEFRLLGEAAPAVSIEGCVHGARYAQAGAQAAPRPEERPRFPVPALQYRQLAAQPARRACSTPKSWRMCISP